MEVIMSDTRDKLLEAKYFLERMAETQSNRDAFKYNLSAFLAAARSVTAIMQKEFDGISGFKAWYEEMQAKLQSDDTVRLLKDKRDITIHQQPVRPRAHVNVSVAERIALTDSMSIVITRADGTIERQESEPTRGPMPARTETEAESEWRWYFDELPEKDIVTVCEEHIGRLDIIVRECESRFSSSTNGTPPTELGHSA
jgi:hypothetical protein